jgi:hypothetical protein
MVIKTIPREVRYISYDNYFPVDERDKLKNLRRDYQPREPGIPEYVVHLLVALSGHNQNQRFEQFRGQ